MKVIFLLSLATILLTSCALIDDTADANEFENYDLISFERIISQDPTIHEETDFRSISIEDNKITFEPEANPEVHDSIDSYLNDFVEETLVNISLEDNIIYIEGEESEFTFTPTSRSVYELDNGTRYQPFVIQDGKRLDENPFYQQN